MKTVAIMAVAVAMIGQGATATVRKSPQLAATFHRIYGEDGQHHVIMRQNTESQPGGFTLTPQALIRLDNGWVLVTAAHNDEICHACVSGLALTTLANNHGVPGAAMAQLPFVAGGIGGATPATWRLESRLTQNPTLQVDSGWGGQGCESHGVTLVELTPAAPIVRLDYLPLSIRDDENECCRENLTGKIMSIRPGQSFAVRYTGWKRNVHGPRVPYRLVVIYHLKAGQFVPDHDVTDLMC